MNPDHVGFVFVNYHSEAMIVPRVEELRRAGFHVVVADNSGTFPEGRGAVWRMPMNVGFGVACNRAVNAMPKSVTTLCFHNPDAQASLVAIDKLADRLGDHRRPGILVPALLTGRRVRAMGFRYPTAPREFLLAGRATMEAQRRALVKEYLPRAGGRRFGSCAFAMISRDAFDAVSGFDEAFFLYAEDLDLWHRISLRGYSTGFAPDVVVRHEGKLGSPAGRVRRELLRWIGVELFAERHGAGWRRLRAAHLPFLGKMRPEEPELVKLMSRHYARFGSPAGLAEEVRALLAASTE